MSSRPVSRIGRVLRTIAWALLFAFVFGLLLGSWIRKQLEEPVRYIGNQELPAHSQVIAILTTGLGATAPGDVGHTESCILVTSQYEEKV